MKITKFIAGAMMFFIYGTVTSTISKENLTTAMDTFITKLIENKEIPIKKFTSPLADELAQRRNLIQQNLEKKMNENKSSYISVSMLEKEVHEGLDGFLKHAQHVLNSIAHKKLIQKIKTLTDKNPRSNRQSITS